MFDDIRNENKYKNYSGGKWVESENYIKIYSPIDGRIIGDVPALSKEEVDCIIKNAKESQEEWKHIPSNEKAEILYKAADLLDNQKDELVKVLMLEVAKDKKSALSEVERTADFIRFTADWAKGVSGQSLPGDSFPGFKKNKISVVSREPLGVVLAISPFNYPINLSASKIAPALMAGNSVVFKPATQGSICGLHLVRIFQEAGLPGGVINTITGRGSEIGDYVVTHPNIDFINFTGSTDVGLRISRITAMTPMIMELGGKDAAIVLADADLDLTVDNIVSGAYSYSGQRCTAVKRILVEEEVADKLVEKLRERVLKLKVGNPLESDDVTIVPLIDSKACDFVWELIDDAREKGAKLLTGGKRDGNYIEPTLFDFVTEDMRIAWEEPFGPVLPVIRVKSKDEAIKIANKSLYGLQSAVFTNNINDAFYVADKLEVGTVQVNNKTERGPDHFPFLGVKASGVGTQGIGHSIEAMSRPKVTVINLNN